MHETILVERDGPIATVILNRPAKLNALTRAMWRELGAAIDTLSADDDLRCIIVRGAGEQSVSRRATTSANSRPSARTRRRRSHTAP